jgi:hypothetical protein
MAAATESQGLKIAVVVFITLTVILVVTSYFLYSNYSSAEARLASAEEKTAASEKSSRLASQEFQDLRIKVGTTATDPEPVKEEIAGQFKKLEERLTNMAAKALAEVQKAQASGAQGPELEEAKQNVQKTIDSLRSEPNKSFISTLDRMAELMENVSLLSTELALSYVNVRHNLESSTSVNKQLVDVQTKAATDARNDVLAEQKKHEEERGTLLTKVDQYQTDSDKKQTQITNLEARLKQNEEDFNRSRDTLRTILIEQRDRLERKEVILDRPDGYVTYVDYETAEVHVSLTRKMGARPQMKMTIFDARSPGIPTEKPKGTIELIAVGEQFSVARVMKTFNPIDPIRVGDIVYSAAWSPNQPMRFALVGKLDMNRDSKDDREELKRMIQEAGGVVDFDLPPPDLGKETGTLSPKIDWYVTDDRMPLRDSYQSKARRNTSAEAKLAMRVGEVTKEARRNGIRPLPIERLLAFLGYDMNTAVVGRTEAVDPKALLRLTAPRRTTEAQAKPADETMKAQPKAAETKGEEMAEPSEDQPKAKAKAKTKGGGKGGAKKKVSEDEAPDDAEPK